MRFDTAVDVSFLLLLDAVLRTVRAHAGYSLTIDHATCGLTLLGPGGTARQLVFLYGRSAQTAYRTLSAYIGDLESEHRLPAPEVVVVPCQQYRAPSDADLAPERADNLALPGDDITAVRHFIDPDAIFNTASLAALQALVRDELDL